MVLSKNIRRANYRFALPSTGRGIKGEGWLRQYAPFAITVTGVTTSHPGPLHESRSSQREEAPSEFREKDQSLLTSAATVQGFKAQNFISGNSTHEPERRSPDRHEVAVRWKHADREIGAPLRFRGTKRGFFRAMESLHEPLEFDVSGRHHPSSLTLLPVEGRGRHGVASFAFQEIATTSTAAS